MIREDDDLQLPGHSRIIGLLENVVEGSLHLPAHGFLEVADFYFAFVLQDKRPLLDDCLDRVLDALLVILRAVA